MFFTLFPEAATMRPLPAFRLRTLIGMRWFASIGQVLVVALVAFGFGYPLPLGPLLAVIAVGVWVNLYTQFTRKPGTPLTEGGILLHLGIDTLQISSVLFLTGGIQNPFAVWLIMPAMLAASSLPRARAAVTVGLVIACLTVLALLHYPLPWRTAEGFALPPVYRLGLWFALTMAVGFTASYAHGVAREQAKLAAALATMQTSLAREERLAALDGLAAAAAHELGTPLGTIQVTAREMERELEGDLKEDAALLISQTQRCQTILRRLSSAGTTGDAVHSVLSLDALLREAAAPFLDAPGPRIDFRLDPDSGAPLPERLRRRPEVIYGLRNILENAVKFARGTVTVEASWSDRFLTVTVTDDGPGFPDGMLSRLGEPYPRADAPRLRTERAGADKAGLGLGFFIAKTLLERTGASLTHDNRPAGEGGGARVRVVWPLANLVMRPTSRGETRPIEAAQF
ncbi:ActS/PrrB/RegB family redox-sensitive histidine kinase [Parvularcula dongshanensis]|uniref:histidine kinase n=1 Tax=Parvularcula dongshanensis TaxID=1173995 RepID=A0A840I1F3_9PROT|nr:ActS/PrrB/RegB family redox-sensitive histidine kinase [Parvularcula dongshanensis]MBB4658052.1 two-component system sensor histidine kinase RegB [Parvularcula dongshanensis]